MKFLLFLAGAGVAFIGLTRFGRFLRECDQTPYVPDSTKRSYRPGMSKPDKRFNAVPGIEQAWIELKAREVREKVPPQPTAESIELALAYRRLCRIEAGLDPDTGKPTQVH